jgi:hypothetical protein
MAGTGASAQSKAAMDAASAAAGSLGASASEAASSLQDAASGAASSLQEAASGALSSVNEATSGAVDSALSVYKELADGLGEATSSVQVPTTLAYHSQLQITLSYDCSVSVLQQTISLPLVCCRRALQQAQAQHLLLQRRPQAACLSQSALHCLWSESPLEMPLDRWAPNISTLTAINCIPYA